MYFVNAGPEPLTIFSQPWGNAEDAVGMLAVGRVVEARKKCLADGQVWLQLRPGNCVDAASTKEGAQGARSSSGAMVVLQASAFVLDVAATRGREAGANLLRVPGPGNQAGAWPPALCGAAPWSCLYVAQAALAVRSSLPAAETLSVGKAAEVLGHTQPREANVLSLRTATVPAFRVFEVDRHATVHGKIYGRLARGAGQWTPPAAAAAATVPPAAVPGASAVAGDNGTPQPSVASDLTADFAAAAVDAPASGDVASVSASGSTSVGTTEEERWVCLTDMLPFGNGANEEGSSKSATNSSDIPLVQCARVLDVPLGEDAPWGFRNATKEGLSVRALPQVEDSTHNSAGSNNENTDDGASVVVGTLPPFACVQARGSRLGPNGQLWVHCAPPPPSSQGGAATGGGGGHPVLGWVALLNLADGTSALEPFPLDATGTKVCDLPPPPSSSSSTTALTSSDTNSSAVVPSSALNDNSLTVSPPRPRWFDDGGGTGPRARCYRNVLTKAALPFREDPSLASPVVARVALGGCLTGTGKRLVTSQGQLWLQCWLPGMPEPLWAVERNAKNGTAILTAVRGPDCKLNNRQSRLNRATSVSVCSPSASSAALAVDGSAEDAATADAETAAAAAAAAAQHQREEHEVEQQQRAHDQRLKKRLRVYRVVSALGGSSVPVLSAAGYGGATTATAAAAAPPGGVVELGTLPPNTLLVGGERRLSSKRANPRTLWVQLHRVVMRSQGQLPPRYAAASAAAAAAAAGSNDTRGNNNDEDSFFTAHVAGMHDPFAHMYGGWLPESVTGVSASLEEVDGCDATAILERGSDISGVAIGESDEAAMISADETGVDEGGGGGYMGNHGSGEGSSLEDEEGTSEVAGVLDAPSTSTTTGVGGTSSTAAGDRQRRSGGGGGPDFEVKAVEMKAALASSLGHFKRFGSQVSGQVDALASRTSNGFPRSSSSSYSGGGGAGTGGVSNSGSGNGAPNNGLVSFHGSGTPSSSNFNAMAGAEAATATTKETTALFDLARPLGMVLDGLRVCEASEGSQAQGAGVGNGWVIKCVNGVKVATQPELFAKLKEHKDAAASLAEKVTALRAAAEVAMGARQATAAAEFEANAHAARLVQIDKAAATEAVAAAAAAEAGSAATAAAVAGEAHVSEASTEESTAAGSGNGSVDDEDARSPVASHAAAAVAGAALDRAAQARMAAVAATEAAADAANAAADAELAAEGANREAEAATAAAKAANRVELTFLIPANHPLHAGSAAPTAGAAHTASTAAPAATLAATPGAVIAPPPTTSGQVSFPAPPSAEHAGSPHASVAKSPNDQNTAEPLTSNTAGVRDATARALLAAAEAEAAAKAAQLQEEDSLDALLSPQRHLHSKNNSNSSSGGGGGKDGEINNNSSSGGGDDELEDEDSAVFLAAQLDARRVAREAAARAQAAQHEADELKRMQEEAVANALAAKEAAAALKASQEAEALAEAQAQRIAAEAAHAAELTDLMSALDEFSDHDKKLQAQENGLLHSPSSSSSSSLSTLEPPSGGGGRGRGGSGSTGRKRTPPPAISPPGNYYLGALTVRLRRTPPSAAARQREAKRRAKKRRQDAALPEVVSTSIFGDSDDSDDDSSEDEDNNEFMGGGNGASGPQEPRATIYYTTDGTDPNPRFALTSPLQLDVGPGTTHVKAMAWARGCDPSPVVHAKFVVYGDQDSRMCCALALAVRAHHALFALKPVQRLRRWVFWPRRRDRATGRNIKRTSYTQLSGHAGSSSSSSSPTGSGNRHRSLSSGGGGSSGDGSFEDDFDSPGGFKKGPKVVGGGGLDSNDLARAARYSATHQGKHGSSKGGSGRPSVCCLLRAAGAATMYATERVCGFGQDREGYGTAFAGGEYDDLDNDDDDLNDASFDFDHGIELDFTSLPSPESPSSSGGASV